MRLIARCRILLLLLLAGCASLRPPGIPAYTVEVAAGEFDREEVPVSFPLPGGASGAGFRLVDEAGRVIPVQLSAGRQATFILERLAAGATRRYRLEAVAIDAAPGVQAQRGEGAVTLAVAGQPVLRYNASETPLPGPEVDPVFRRGGYIHPVHTPAGKIITDDYPPNHLHHHGIWAAWTRTVFEGRELDFWNMGDRKGTVEPVSLDTTWSGSVHAGFRARHRYLDLTAPSPRGALDETWTVHLYNVQGSGRPYRIFDLEVVQTTASSSVLLLPEYHYGGVGFRGRREWNGEENTFFLTSEGRDRSDGHGTRARWCHIGGFVEGALAGVGILGHPENFRFPQHMRIHPTEPFFNWAPSQAGDWAIQPGQPYIARYRFVVYDGAPDAGQLDRLWNDYAHPPTVMVTVPSTSRPETRSSR
ncbi:MAG: PmoA family protein [Longimicrobiaceae bacterium]